MTHEEKKLVWLCAGEVRIIARIIGTISKTKGREDELSIAGAKGVHSCLNTIIIGGRLKFTGSTHDYRQYQRLLHLVIFLL